MRPHYSRALERTPVPGHYHHRVSVRRYAPLVAGLTVLTLAASACGAREGQSVARELGEVKARMDQVDCDIAAIQPARPITPASTRQWAADVRKELRRYDRIREDALALQEDAQHVVDTNLQRAADLLVRMIDQRQDGTTFFVQAVERAGPFRRRLLDLFGLVDEEVKRTDEQWRQIAERLGARYGHHPDKQGCGDAPNEPLAPNQPLGVKVDGLDAQELGEPGLVLTNLVEEALGVFAANEQLEGLPRFVRARRRRGAPRERRRHGTTPVSRSFSEA
jgi:hypothetical protein